jgi:hypothetical protein
MAFVCKNISPLSKLVLNGVSGSFKNNDLFLPYLNKDLFMLLHTYNNLITVDEVNTDIENFKTKILTNLLENIKPEENFGNDTVFTIFGTFAGLFNQTPSQQYKDILVKSLTIMNDYSELFKTSQLEYVIKLLSIRNLYEIRTSVGRTVNLFKKKSNKVEQLNILQQLGLANSGGYKVSVDIVNNLVVLTDKKNTDKHIVFIELGHCGKDSLSLYSSLMSSMNPRYVLIDYEPYVVRSGEGVINRSVFNDAKEYKELLKGANNDLMVKGENIYDIKRKEYLEVESIIYSSLLDKREVELIDSSYNDYSKSFVDSLTNTDQYVEYITTMNVLELAAWIALQEKNGCKSCASFLNRNAINWTPMHPEFLVKPILPNYDSLQNHKADRVATCIKKSKPDENIFIFTTRSHKLAASTLSMLSGSNNVKNSSEYQFDLKQGVKEIALSLLLKQSNVDNIYYNNPPINLTSDCDLRSYQKAYRDIYKKIYFNDNEINISELQDGNTHRSGDKLKQCEPLEYVRTLIQQQNKLI